MTTAFAAKMRHELGELNKDLPAGGRSVEATASREIESQKSPQARTILVFCLSH